MSFGHINSQPHRHGPTPRRPSFEKTKVRKERKKRTTRILVPQAGPLRSFQAIHRRKIHVSWGSSSHMVIIHITGWLPGWVTQKFQKLLRNHSSWDSWVPCWHLAERGSDAYPRCLLVQIAIVLGNLGQGPCIDGNDATYHRFFVG